jgi:hydroxysqualene synthase
MTLGAAAVAPPQLEAAYGHCLQMARSHYENFPVASLALPARLRRPVAAIYAFARTADDLADEGAHTREQRLAGLATLEEGLGSIAAGGWPDDPVLLALADSVRAHALDLQPFRDLLSAFRMDVTATRYADFGALMGYCRNSANPVGRLLLQLYGAATPRNIGYSDAVCSALQLINFLQDLAQDYEEKGRIYIPQDEMARFGVSEAHFRERRTDTAMRGLMVFQAERAERLLRSGAPLGRVLRGRIGFELRLIMAGGARIAAALQACTEDAFARPRLGTRDRLWMLWRALWSRPKL